MEGRARWPMPGLAAGHRVDSTHHVNAPGTLGGTAVVPRPIPDFVIVGAPRAGTTSLYAYLRSHPQVYMPANKEPHFFGSDLTRQHSPMSLGEYRALFRRAKSGQRTGEASPLYLMSECAAAEIRALQPDARIIIMLRHPVELIQSLHQQNLAMGVENVDDLRQALELEPDRREGRALPPRTRAIDALRYRAVSKLADQVERFQASFPAEQIHLIFFDDLRADAQAVFAGVTRFLRIDPLFRDSDVALNSAGTPHWWRLQHWLMHPTPPFDRLATSLRRSGTAHGIRGWILRLNRGPAPRRPMDPALRQALEDEFRPEVARLQELTGRALSCGSQIGVATGAAPR